MMKKIQDTRYSNQANFGKQISITVYCLFTAFLFLAFFTLAFAQEPTPSETPKCVSGQKDGITEYCLLESLPLGEGFVSKDKVSTKDYLPGLFRLIIGIAGVLAVLRIIWGGVQYMSTDAWSGKNDAKGTIENALWGLILAMTAWLIVYTINPKLVEFDLRITPIKIGETKIPDEIELPPGGPVDPDCPNCVFIGVPAKSGSQNGCKSTGFCRVDGTLNERLKDLHSKQKSGLYITEAYPPTRPHQAGCHSNGTCVDARDVSDSRIYQFIKDAADSKLRAEFEVETQARKNAIMRASCGDNFECRNTISDRVKVLPPKNGERQITAEHFSIYLD